MDLCILKKTEFGNEYISITHKLIALSIIQDDVFFLDT